MNIKHDENISPESIKIGEKSYFYDEEDTISIQKKELEFIDIEKVPIGLWLNVFDECKDNCIVYNTIPHKIQKQSNVLFLVEFDETNTRKYWYEPIGLEVWINIRRNILEKLHFAKIEHYDDDGAYIQFNYSISKNATTFKDLLSSIDIGIRELNIATEIAITSPSTTLDYKFYHELNSLRMVLKDCDDNSLQFNYFKIELSKKIERHLRDNNPDKLLLEYRTLFSTKEFNKKIIKSGQKFYRGRIGHDTIRGAIDDCNQEFVVPYNCKDIEVAPSLYTSGGRFNRASTSYLYLATDIETCLAEVHLQVGQLCSIGEFECIEEIELINLSNFADDLELKAWYEIITQPVYDSIKYKYFITQFMSEVLMQFNSNGLFFKSVQSEGENIVCFKPDKFKLVKFSEKLYKADKIKYSFNEYEDTIRKYSERDDSYLLNPYNSNDDDENEKKFNYMEECIEHEKKM